MVIGTNTRVNSKKIHHVNVLDLFLAHPVCYELNYDSVQCTVHLVTIISNNVNIIHVGLTHKHSS
jgi:hypothetical protein